MSITTRIESIEEHIEQAYDELQGLGADLTGIDKNIENISMVLDDIYDSMPQVSGEGTSLTLDDTRVGKIKSTLKGNTSQTGTPTPTTPIPINVVSGDNEIIINNKNLLKPYQLSGSHTANGLTATMQSNGTMLVNGTATGNTWIEFVKTFGNTSETTKILYPLDTTKTYIQSSTVISGTISGTANFSIQVNTNTNSSTSVSATKQITGANGVYRAWLYVGNGAVLTNAVIGFQLEEGTTASSYEANQRDTYNIDLGVKNLISFGRTEGTYSGNGTTFEEGKYYPNMVRDSGNVGTSCEMVSHTSDILTIKGHYTMGVGYPIKCEPNKDYFVKVTSTDTNARIWVSFYDNTGTYISGSPNNADLERATTSPSNASWIVPIFAVYGSSVTSVTFSNIKVIEGNKNQSISENPIELCSSQDGTLRDSFIHDKTNDKWYLHKEIGKSDLIDENTSLQSINSYGIANFLVQPIETGVTDTSKLNNSLCNRFSVQTTGIANTQTEGFLRTLNAGIGALGVYIRISSDKANTVETFKAWLGNNPTYYYWALYTPTNTEITYQPLIDQLNELEKAQSKENQTNISQVNNDLPFIISASALKEWQESTSLNSTLSMVNPLSLGNTLNTQENNIQPIEVDNIEPLEEEENEES